jgi:zinc/manganese transport system substrate-binding protein
LEEWSADAAKLRDTPVVVYHDNWAYMLRWLGMKKVAALEVKPGIPPTPSHLQDVLAASKRSGVKLILLTPFDNDDAAKWLAGQTGARMIRLPFTVGGTEDAKTLDALFSQTIFLLKDAAR